MNELEKTLNVYFGEKAPALPENWKKAIVKYSPWITLVVLILSLPALLALFGLSALLLPVSFMGGVGSGAGFGLAVLILAVTVVLEALAIPHLMKTQRQGWLYAYYATLISAVYNLVRLDLGSLIIGTAISLYFLFQIRSYYK